MSVVFLRPALRSRCRDIPSSRRKKHGIVIADDWYARRDLNPKPSGP